MQRMPLLVSGRLHHAGFQPEAPAPGPPPIATRQTALIVRDGYASRENEFFCAENGSIFCVKVSIGGAASRRLQNQTGPQQPHCRNRCSIWSQFHCAKGSFYQRNCLQTHRQRTRTKPQIHRHWSALFQYLVGWNFACPLYLFHILRCPRLLRTRCPLHPFRRRICTLALRCRRRAFQSSSANDERWSVDERDL